MAARQISTLLLRLGTVPFIIVPFAVTVSPEWPPNLDHGLHIALVCHTGIVLAFIGGLQQAAAIGAPSLPHASSIAGLAIAVAIASCYAVFATALRGVTAHEPMILFCAYMAQSVIERCHVPGMMRKAMLHEERTIPMTVASASLLFMARRAAGGAAALLENCSVLVCLGLVLVVACILLPHRLRRSDPSFNVGAISRGSDEPGKGEADAPARPRRRGKSPKR